MKNVPLILTFVFNLIISVLYGQVQLLKNYHFEKGGYCLIGIHSSSDRNGLADSLGEFYTDNINVLNAIKKDWIFKKPSPNYACGFHYEILILKDGKELESFDVNLNCNEIATNKGAFFFETDKLRKFKNEFIRPISTSKNFKSLNEARKYYENIIKDNKLIYTTKPDWLKYEGEFSFTYICKKGNKDCMDNEEKVLKNLTLEIKKAYPNEEFELESKGGSSTELFVGVKCNKSLNDKFQLYKRKYLKDDNWEPFYLSIRTYWKR